MSLLKRPWRRIVRAVRESGEPEAVSITLERNREAAVEMGAVNPPDLPIYRFKLGLRAGFSGDQTPSIPVLKRVNPNPHPILKEIFYCEVAGSELEAANVHALQLKVARMLETLAPARALPLAYFRAPAADYSLAVYEEGGGIVCPMIAGPNLRADDLAGMRRNVCRHLLSSGYVSDPSQVEIEVVRPSDLKLVAPAAVIRSLELADLWLPAVEGHSAEGIVIGVLGQTTELRPARRRLAIGDLDSPPAANDVASLLRLVGNRLADAGTVEDPFAIYASQVRPEIWRRTEGLTDDSGERLVCWLEGDEPSSLELRIRRTAAGELLVALEHDGISVFAGADEQLLAKRLGQYLSEGGYLRFAEAVEVVRSAAAPEPEDAQLWRSGGVEFSRLTFGERVRAAENTKQIDSRR